MRMAPSLRVLFSLAFSLVLGFVLSTREVVGAHLLAKVAQQEDLFFSFPALYCR